jgi:hypothetical protein
MQRRIGPDSQSGFVAYIPAINRYDALAELRLAVRVDRGSIPGMTEPVHSKNMEVPVQQH